MKNLENKLDEIIHTQISIQVDLKDHMRRTELNEQRIERIEDINSQAITRIHDKLDAKVDTKYFFWGLGTVTLLITLAIGLAKLFA